MTFTDLRGAVCDYCNLTSSDAQARVGKAINRHYRRITASLGLDAARFVTRSASMTVGVATVTFSEIEKIDRILDTTDSTAIRLIPEVSVHHLRTIQPGASQPCQWAYQNADADSVTVLFDTVPQTAYSLQADGWTTLADLTGSAEPVFPESYHDILVWFVISEELLKKEKEKLAAAYHTKATNLLSELRFFLADTHTRDLIQNNAAAAVLGTSSGGGSASLGASAYTQSALLTFDRGAGIVPFAVARSDAPYVVNLGAEFLGNVTTDRLLGRDTSGTGESELISLTGGLEFTGSQSIRIADVGITTAKIALLAVTTATINDLAVTTGKINDLAVTNAKVSASAAIAYSKLALTGALVDADVSGSAAITWTKVSKSGSSLADLATRSAADLSSGTVNEARLGSGTGSVNKVLRGNNTWGESPGITTDGSSLVQQIAFAGTQSASAGANTLDDYEEGTWTPVIGGSGGTSGQTYTSQLGHYIKIGQLVTLTFTVLLSAKGTITGNCRITGLPFTIHGSASTAAMALGWNTTNTNWVSIVAQLNPSGTNVEVMGAAAAAASNLTSLTTTDITNTTQLSGVITYRATA